MSAWEVRRSGTMQTNLPGPLKGEMVMKKLILMCLLIGLLTGCASYVVRDGTGKIISQGEANGFLRTVTVVEEYDTNGNITKRSISTESTTKDVLMGLNEFMDTTAETYDRLAPK